MNAPVVNRIFKNTIALTIASAGSLVGNIILVFYLSRLLHPEGLGIYSTVLALFSTVGLGCEIMNPFIPRELPKDLTKTNLYLTHGSAVATGAAIVLMIGLGLLTPHLGYLPQTQMGIYIISLALIPHALSNVMFTVFISHQKAIFNTYTTVLITLGRIVFSLLALRLGYGVISLIVIFTIFGYISLLLNYFFLRRYIQVPHWEFNWQFLKKMVYDLKYFAALTMLNALFSQSELIVLSIMSGETQVGFYSAALKLVTIWSMVPVSYMTALFPVLSATYQQSQQKARDLQNRSIRYLLALAFPLSFGISIAASQIILTFYDPSFSGSIEVLRIVAWYLPLTFCNMVFWRVLYVRDEQRNVFRIQLTTVFAQLLLAVGLIPILGSRGAAWALLGGNFTYAVFSMYFIVKDKTPLPLFQISWRFIVSSIVMGAVTWVGLSRLNLVIVIAMAIGVYLIMIWFLRAFSPHDVLLIKQMLGISKNPEILQPGSETIELKE